MGEVLVHGSRLTLRAARDDAPRDDESAGGGENGQQEDAHQNRDLDFTRVPAAGATEAEVSIVTPSDAATTETRSRPPSWMCLT